LSIEETQDPKLEELLSSKLELYDTTEMEMLHLNLDLVFSLVRNIARKAFMEEASCAARHHMVGIKLAPTERSGSVQV
jgi:hypothetical protein